MKRVLRQCLRTLTANRKVVSVARNVLRHFPTLDERVRVWFYLLKKKVRQDRVVSLQKDGTAIQTERNSNKRKLLVDVSELALRDVHTGIQRVVRSLLLELMNDPPAGYVVEPVYMDGLGQLRYAREVAVRLNRQELGISDESPVRIQPGDVFFCPDLHLGFPFITLAPLRQSGLRVVFVVHDIFGLKNAAILPKAYNLAFSDWFAGVMSVADAVVCVSRAVADEVLEWLQDHPGQRCRPLPIGYFHLGADIEASKPTQGPADEGADVLAACEVRPSLLMVGTLEPRKGHVQAIEAVEALWRSGMDLNLIIVGKEGWRSHRLVRQLRRHGERNRQLFWLENASDALLLQLYGRASALLAASLAEGFGLPLIEAARRGLPIIARDIPVFREVAGEYAFYFPDSSDNDTLASSLRVWFRLHAEDRAPRSKDMPYCTWAQSAQQLQRVIFENDWYKIYAPPKSTS